MGFPKMQSDMEPIEKEVKMGYRFARAMTQEDRSGNTRGLGSDY